jgi:phosphodiesterase/alkaline phosphatase D-like protein
VAKGSFKADGSATYTIVAYDNAGNKSAEVSFEPLGLEVTPVTAITNTTAHIEAQVIQGTNPLSKSLCYIEYKKATETSYDTVLVNKTDTASGIEMIYNFSKLTPDTVYNYRVHAATLNSSEERVIEGSFKTLSGNSTTTVRQLITIHCQMM